MYPNMDSVGLSRMQLILYSKFCAATIRKKNPGIRIQGKKNKIFTKGIQKKRPILPFVRCDLSTGARNTRIKIKCFPKPIYAAFAGSGTNVEKHTDIWLKFRHRHMCICSQEELSTPAAWERMH